MLGQHYLKRGSAEAVKRSSIETRKRESRECGSAGGAGSVEVRKRADPRHALFGRDSCALTSNDCRPPMPGAICEPELIFLFR